MELTRGSLALLHINLLDTFPPVNNTTSGVSVYSQSQSKAFLVRMIFEGEAQNIDNFLRSYYNPEVRAEWDMDLKSQNITQTDK